MTSRERCRSLGAAVGCISGKVISQRQLSSCYRVLTVFVHAVSRNAHRSAPVDRTDRKHAEAEIMITPTFLDTTILYFAKYPKVNGLNAMVVSCRTTAGVWLSLKACGCKPSDLRLAFMQKSQHRTVNDGNRSVNRQRRRQRRRQLKQRSRQRKFTGVVPHPPYA